VCVGYNTGKKVITDYPYELTTLDSAEPVYETFEGWSEDISSIKKYEDLPENAKTYLKAIEDFIKVPITFISVGPERTENIII
jgi:adenylosuccinate synthase